MTSAAPVKQFPPTAQQQAFINAIVNTTSNLALVARAGSGKTSTILLAVKAIVERFPYADTVVCAYNKAIADEVSIKLKELNVRTEWTDGNNGRRVPPQVTASTLHSLGFAAVRTMFKDIKIEENKVRDLIDAKNDPFWIEWQSQICALVSYAKGAGFGFFSDLPISDTHAWFALADHYDVNGVDDMLQMERIVECAQQVYIESLQQTDRIDFDDMILWPLIKNIRVKYGKDFIFLDEAQDLSRTRQALAKKYIKVDYNGRTVGRMFVVGDDRQAIYGFSGADAAALSNLIDSLHCEVLPLTVTWRCPKAVVKLAQGLVPDLEYAPTAEEGVVEHVEEFPDDMGAGDAILCRNTAPLISTAYKLIRKGTPCKVEGRAIGEGLDKLVTRWKIRGIDALINKLHQHKEREMQKALAKGSEAKAEEVADRVDTLVEICNAVIAQGHSTIEHVRAFITNLFADGAEGVLILATYHRSKGREWDRVMLLEHFERCPSRAARSAWQREQEANLAYVAYTRAKKTLLFVG